MLVDRIDMVPPVAEVAAQGRRQMMNRGAHKFHTKAASIPALEVLCMTSSSEVALYSHTFVVRGQLKRNLLAKAFPATLSSPSL